MQMLNMNHMIANQNHSDHDHERDASAISIACRFDNTFASASNALPSNQTNIDAHYADANDTKSSAAAIYCVCDRKNFDNFLWATVTVFQVDAFTFHFKNYLRVVSCS